MNESNVATLNVAKTPILTIQTADLYLQLSQPANSIEFNVTYNPQVFSFLPNSVQCTLPLTNLDYSKPGIVSFKFKSEDPNMTANAVSFSFRPLMAVPLSGFIANGLVTNTGATLTVPTANITVQLTGIEFIPTQRLNPNIQGQPLQSVPMPIHNFWTLPLTPDCQGQPLQSAPMTIYYIPTFPLNPNVGGNPNMGTPFQQCICSQNGFYMPPYGMMM